MLLIEMRRGQLEHAVLTKTADDDEEPVLSMTLCVPRRREVWVPLSSRETAGVFQGTGGCHRVWDG